MFGKLHESREVGKLPRALHLILETWFFVSVFNIILSLLLYRLDYIKYGVHFFFIYMSFLSVFPAVVSKTGWGYSFVEDSRAFMAEDRVMILFFNVKIKHIMIDIPITVCYLLSIGILAIQIINIFCLASEGYNLGEFGPRRRAYVKADVIASHLTAMADLPTNANYLSAPESSH